MFGYPSIYDRFLVCICECRSVMGLSVVAMVRVMIKVTVMLIMMMMMTLSMTSHEPLIYCPITAPNGTRLCAIDDVQTAETFPTEKVTTCALANMARQSVIFNYESNLTHRQCTRHCQCTSLT